jgi:hypothetical protein
MTPHQIAVAAFTLAIATSAEAMSLVPLHQPDGMVTQAIAFIGTETTPNCRS